MRDGYQSQAGQAMCAQTAPPSEHATAAQLWAEAKTRALMRSEEKEHADIAHSQAVIEEKEAWERLEYAAGRAVPKAPEKPLRDRRDYPGINGL